MGKVIMSGIVPQLVVPVTGTPLGEIAVGSSVYLNENGSPVEYLVVNQGIPSDSSLYDVSCDGTWLMRKDIWGAMTWNSTLSSAYGSSTIHTYLNETILARFDTATQAAIQQVKIPYGAGDRSSVVYSGSNGLSTKLFLLSGYEVGWTTSNSSYFPIDGAKLDYFISGTTDAAKNARIAYRASTASTWWLRSNCMEYSGYPWVVNSMGENSYGAAHDSNNGIRPALILPSDLLVKDDGTIKV